METHVTVGDAFDRYCQTLIDLPRLGVRLDCSRMNFTDAWFKGIESALDRALDAMTQLEQGAIANPDEGRRVGHYWLRSPALAPEPELTSAILSAQQQVLTFAKKVHTGALKTSQSKHFSDALLIGIGGSALGPQLISDALGQSSDKIRLHFMDNTDPDGIDRVLASLGERLATTLVMVVSKSGGTAETRNGMLETAYAFARAGLSFAQHAVAITSEGSLLFEQATKEGWLEIFPMWDWVGGRTSVMSPVGLLPMALQGHDIEGLLRGAAAMDSEGRSRTLRRNPAAMLAAMWHWATDGVGNRAMVVLPYKDRLVLMSKYLQQLVMESLGKKEDLEGKTVHQGIVVYGNKGSTDQHAYVQQLREGPNNFFATFIEVLQDREGESLFVSPDTTSGDYLLGFLLGTRQALYEAGRESITLTLTKLDAFRVGALIALFERAVGIYAALVGINAYHQPGVEAGKKAASTVLKLQVRLLEALRAGARGTARILAAHIQAPAEEETLLKLLEHLAANGRIQRYAVGSHPWEAEFSL